MTAASRRRLEDAVREALTRAYLHGALQMSAEGSVPLGYPEADAETAKVIAAVTGGGS